MTPMTRGIGAPGRATSVLVAAGVIAASAAVTTCTAARAAMGRTFVPEPNAKDWSVYGHDLANTRLNPNEKSVNRKSVARLTQSWSKDGLTGVSGTPTVARGVAYFGDWQGTVWAVEAKTGKDIWSTKIGSGGFGFIVGAPAIDGDAVYVSTGGKLFRLDRDTGEVRWQVVTNEHELAQINASPVVVDGLVLQGVASAEVAIPRSEYTFRGTIGAYDAKTGSEKWRFYTTPNDTSSGAGVGIWSTPAVDRKRGTLYVGSGNNYDAPAGPLADSILAIDYKTGKLKWSRQFTYPDVFSAGNPSGKDADVGASPNLWTYKGRAFVGAGDKGGVYHALDRNTGKVVWETTLTPGSLFGGEIGSAALVDGKLIAVSNVGNPATNAPTNVAKVFALDPTSGKIRWEAEDFAGKIFAPVGAVPGVAFVGTDTGVLAALDTRTGKQLWTQNAPEKTGCGPSIVDGRVLWGFGFFLFQGGGNGGVISFTIGK
jgi:polyvinyl alcohol dehydrogenase (cytochrome)